MRRILFTLISLLGLPVFGLIAAESPVEKVSIPFKEVDAAALWQKVPDDPGDVISFGLDAIPVTRPGGKTTFVAGHRLGLLFWSDAGTWKFVPELLGRHLTPLGVSDGLLWVREGSTYGGQPGKGVFGLDPTDFSVQRSHTGITDHCVTADIDGFWSLGKYKRIPWPENVRGDADRTGFTALTQYGFDGKPLLLFEMDRETVPPGSIRWFTIDPDNVWMVLSTARPTGGGPERSYPALVFHIDRKTNKRRSAELTVPHFLDRPFFTHTPDRIIWVTPDDRKVHEVDKKTLKHRVVATLDEQVHVDRVLVLADSKNLWLFNTVYEKGKASVLSLDGYRPVPLADAGEPPLGAPSPYYFPAEARKSPAAALIDGLRSTAGDTLWFLGHNSVLVELRGDGSMFARDLTSVLPDFRPRFLVAVPGAVYVASPNVVCRVEQDKAEAIVRRFTRPTATRIEFPWFHATAQRVWVSVWYHYSPYKRETSNLAISPDLAAMQEIKLPAEGEFELRRGVAFENALFLTEERSDELFRVDGNSGNTAFFSSAGMPARKDRSLRSVFRISPTCVVFRFSSGRQSFVVWDPVADRTTALPEQPIRDTTDFIAYLPVTVAGKIYGIRNRKKNCEVAEWTDKGWQCVLELPMNMPPQSVPALPAALIGQYLYLTSPASPLPSVALLYRRPVHDEIRKLATLPRPPR